ncbi:hypothetical protein H0X48_05835 [Candidatus Dependentiae bacterium]|nr:hypothetical protein [Candidatus Dependentiae bacterium]
MKKKCLFVILAACLVAGMYAMDQQPNQGLRLSGSHDMSPLSTPTEGEAPAAYPIHYSVPSANNSDSSNVPTPTDFSSNSSAHVTNAVRYPVIGALAFGVAIIVHKLVDSFSK